MEILILWLFKYEKSDWLSLKLKSTGQEENTKRSVRRKEGNVLFNDALNTFYLRLYGIRHMVKDHSDSERKPAASTWVTLSV